MGDHFASTGIKVDCIEREAAIKEINEIVGYGNTAFVDRYDALNRLKNVPAADVRPVVLCRDCKYSYDSVGGWCCSYSICVDCFVREDFFCADGEKREES